MNNTPEWLSALLNNPKVTDILLNSDQEVFVDTGDGLRQIQPYPQTESPFLRPWVLYQLQGQQKTWDARTPFFDLTLASGHRLHAIFDPIVRGASSRTVISLRRTALCDQALLDVTSCKTEPLERWSTHPALTEALKIVLQRVNDGESLIIAGGTGSGKTTLLNDLLSALNPNERILALEDTPELKPNHRHFISLLSRPPNSDGHGEVSLRTLLKQTLRMRPDRIVLGECRGEEVLELLQLLNTGHKGALATLHANHPRDALKRLELLCLLSARGQIMGPLIRELIGTGIHWLIQVERTPGVRKITQIWQVRGCDTQTILLKPIFQDDRQRTFMDPQSVRPNPKENLLDPVGRAI